MIYANIDLSKVDILQVFLKWAQEYKHQILNTLFFSLVALVFGLIAYGLISRLIAKFKRTDVKVQEVPAISKSIKYASESGDELLITGTIAWYVSNDGTAEKLVSADGKNAPKKGKAIYFAREIKVTEVSLNDESGAGERVQSFEKEYVVLTFESGLVKLGETVFKKA